MQNLIHADIFFFITSISVVVVAVAVIIVTVYLVCILRNLKELSEQAKTEGKDILTDISDLRSSLREEGVYIKNLVGAVKKFLPRDRKKKRTEHNG